MLDNQPVKPDYLLFEKTFGNKPLFANTQALVAELVSNPKSHYYIDPLKAHQEDYLKTNNKLKSFLSQILNGSTKRIVTPEFKESLYEVLRTKSMSKDVLDNFFDNLMDSFSRIKRSLPPKRASITFEETWETFLSDFDDAGYVVLIAVRPYELENDPNEYLTVIRDKTIKELAHNLISPAFKKFRYNVPSREVGKILWRRIHILLCKFFLQSADLGESIKRLRAYAPSDFNIHLPDEIQIRTLVSLFLLKLNKEGSIWVFINQSPIFVCSQIHFDPNEINNSSNFIYFNSGKETIELYKYNKTESIYWQEQVWYRMKEMDSAKSLLYNDDLAKPLDEPL